MSIIAPRQPCVARESLVLGVLFFQVNECQCIGETPIIFLSVEFYHSICHIFSIGHVEILALNSIDTCRCCFGDPLGMFKGGRDWGHGWAHDQHLPSHRIIASVAIYWWAMWSFIAHDFYKSCTIDLSLQTLLYSRSCVSIAHGFITEIVNFCQRPSSN